MEEFIKLSKDLREASKTMTATEARYLVDTYYQMQENRKRAANQERSLSSGEEPHDTISWLAKNARWMENQIKRALDSYSAASPLGEWARNQNGIGPVIAAGLLAHIDLEKAPTVGHIWNFAGLNPDRTWGKGEKRPWNASLKTLCWKIGESFVKVSGNEDAYYAQVYVQRKVMEIEKNDRLEFKDQAEVGLKKVGKSTEAYKHYKEGKLPPGRIHARAKRYAVKRFLAHYHEMGYKLILGKMPPKPYPIAVLGHAHYEPAPA